MLRQLLKKWLPSHEQIKNEQSLRWFSAFLHHPNLWHLNKRSVAGGVAVGLFVAFIPLPLQMVLAMLLALLCRVNIPIAIVATWITNPFTFIPINYLIYKVGGWVTGTEVSEMPKFGEFHWRADNLGDLWNTCCAWIMSLGKTFLIGIPIVSITAAIVGYVIVRIAWRMGVGMQHTIRKKRQASKI